MSQTRRDVLNAGWKVGTGLLAGAGIWTTCEALRPLGETGGGGLLKLAPPEAYGEKTATYVQAGRLYITRVEGQLFAITQKCPHLGCRVPFCEASGRFECPCHGSVFNLGGEWMSGPAPHGMDRYPLRVEDGQVVVDTSETLTGPPLGSHEWDTPHRGGSCDVVES
jgi:nitrite reductase/ring-hydroxylating ferredoxin subunit